jgi:hypothetical protein
MGANYFRLDKAGVCWKDPSFDRSEKTPAVDPEPYNDTFDLMMFGAQQTVAQVDGGMSGLVQGGWVPIPEKTTFTWDPAPPAFSTEFEVSDGDDCLSATQ